MTAAHRLALAEQVRVLNADLRRILAYTQVGELVNTPRSVAGMEGRYYTRAALDPAYATPTAVGALYRALMSGEALDIVERLLTPENRLRVAEAALRGWAIHRPHPTTRSAWHRLFGDQAFNVWIGAPT